MSKRRQIKRLKLNLLLILGAILSACQTVPTAPEAVSRPSSDDAARAYNHHASLSMREQKNQDFDRALGLYKQGRYADAVTIFIPLISAPDLPVATQVEVLKYAAFSHCLMKQLLPCRQHFEMALAKNPSFELSKVERGHPIWGKVFLQAKFRQKHSAQRTNP